MIVGYARVSKPEQSETDALEQQVERLKKAGAVRVFSDVQSGRKDNRKQFNLMLEECEYGIITEIVVTRIDRLGRSTITICKVAKRLEELGIKLNILDASIDSSTATGWVMLAQMGAFAEFESRMLQERVRHGVDYYRKKEKANKPPFGYRKNKDSKYEIDPGSSPIALELIHTFLTSTLRRTVLWLRAKYNIVMTANGLKLWLTNPVLVGDTRYINRRQKNKESETIISNTHEPLISRELRNEIIERLESNKRRYAFSPGGHKADYPLAGLIFCGECGTKCFRREGRKVRCPQHDRLGDEYCKNSKSVDYFKIRIECNSALMLKAQEIANFTRDNQPTNIPDNPELKALKSQLLTLQSLPKSQIIDDAITQTKRQINSLLSTESTRTIPDSLIQVFAEREYWDSLTDEEIAKIYKQFIQKIFINNGHITDIVLDF